MSTNTRIFLIEPRAACQPQGGVARYIRHVVEGLLAKYGNGFAVCSGLKDLPSSLRRVHLPLRYPWRYRSRPLYEATFAWENLLLRATEKRLRPNVIFSPFYGPLASQTPQVFTVYDLILHLYPEYFPSKGRVLELDQMRRCFASAAKIICISNSTRSDLLRLHPDLNPDKVHVVPLGVSDLFRHLPKTSNRSKPYLLFVGTRSGYKNFLRLLEAFALSGLAKEFDLRVISPQNYSPGEWSAPERSLILSNNLQNSVKLTTRASDQELARAYVQATAFIHPSEYEGFGLPVLEALSAGTIVACSKTSSLPEAGGDAAIYFDPLSVESIAGSLKAIAELNATDRAERINQGQRHARNLSWDKCINTTCEILQSVAYDKNLN